jgi:hypothetical protein
VAALALFGQGLEGFALALVGLLTEGVALLQDPDVELELILALVLAALEPAAEDLQEGGASSHGGNGGDDAVGQLAHAGGSRDLQAVAGLRDRLTSMTASCRGDRPPPRRGFRRSGAR